jgi:hypothetical protein
MHATNTLLSDVISLAYHTKQNSASFAGGDASFQVVVNLCGPTSGFTTLVYEPYQNGTVVPSEWQQWDVDAGQFWSSRSVTCGASVVAGGGGAPFYTLSNLQGSFPSAVVIGFGVNIGSNNPSYDVEVDLFKFNNTTYDFEIFSAPTTQDDCFKGGWSTFNPPSGPFKNQGQCVSSTVPQ